MGRDFKEHQINIFAVPFLNIGFTIKYKQAILEELASEDQKTGHVNYVGCPGRRRLTGTKDADVDENNPTMPPELRGKHFDAYWQICKTLGCPREPQVNQLSSLELESDE